MKKLSLAILSLLFLVIMVSSCNKAKEGDTTERFSTLSVEANKATVETAGIDLVKVMKRMKTIETIDAIYNLGDKSVTKGLPFSKDSKLFSTLSIFAAAANGERKLNDVFDAMVSSKDLKGDPQSIKEFWDSNVGTYTWNPAINDWTIVLGGDKVIIKFPSSTTATTNDAILTISSYMGVKMSNPLDADYTGDLPLSFSADLKKGTKTLITYLFAAEYNTDGVPKAVASDLTIENYKFEIDINNDTKIVSAAYKFYENNSIVMDLSASGTGLFTEANYNTNTTTQTETHSYIDYVWNYQTQHMDEITVTYTDTWDETKVQGIINSATAQFQLFNIALRGDVDIKGLIDQLDLIDKDYNNNVINYETRDNRYASRINEFVNLRLVNVNTNEIIAKVESYVVKEINYNYTDTYIDFRLTFKDGSPIDLETYSNTGFRNFVTELNGLIRDINTEFNSTIEPVSY